MQQHVRAILPLGHFRGTDRSGDRCAICGACHWDRSAAGRLNAEGKPFKKKGDKGRLGRGRGANDNSRRH